MLHHYQAAIKVSAGFFLSYHCLTAPPLIHFPVSCLRPIRIAEISLAICSSLCCTSTLRLRSWMERPAKQWVRKDDERRKWR